MAAYLLQSNLHCVVLSGDSSSASVYLQPTMLSVGFETMQVCCVNMHTLEIALKLYVCPDRTSSTTLGLKGTKLCSVGCQVKPRSIPCPGIPEIAVYECAVCSLLDVLRFQSSANKSLPQSSVLTGCTLISFAPHESDLQGVP